MYRPFEISNNNYEGEIARMCVALIKHDDFTIEEINEPNTMAIIQMEIEDFFNDAEECGSSDWFYLRMGILSSMGRPSIYSKEKNKYNERFHKETT